MKLIITVPQVSDALFILLINAFYPYCCSERAIAPAPPSFYTFPFLCFPHHALDIVCWDFHSIIIFVVLNFPFRSFPLYFPLLCFGSLLFICFEHVYNGLWKHGCFKSLTDSSTIPVVLVLPFPAIQLDIFLFLCMVSDFLLKSGHFGYYAMRLWIIHTSYFSCFLWHCSVRRNVGEMASLFPGSLLSLFWCWKEVILVSAAQL